MCSACEAGEYAVANCTATADRQCGACPAGRFQPDRNEDSECEACHVCDAGFYQTTACTSTTDTECFPCPTGKYSVGDGTGCVDCPAGTFSDQAPLASEGDCSECDPGYYQPEYVSSHAHLNPFFSRLLFTLAVWLAGVGRRHASLAMPVVFWATVARLIQHPAQPAKTRATTSTARPVRRNALNATTRRYQSRGAAHASTSSLPARLRLAPALCFAAVSATTANTTKRPTRRQAPRKWNVSGLIRLTSSREPGASRRSKNWKQRTCGCLVDGGVRAPTFR